MTYNFDFIGRITAPDGAINYFDTNTGQVYARLTTDGQLIPELDRPTPFERRILAAIRGLVRYEGSAPLHRTSPAGRSI